MTTQERLSRIGLGSERVEGVTPVEPLFWKPAPPPRVWISDTMLNAIVIGCAVVLVQMFTLGFFTGVLSKFQSCAASAIVAMFLIVWTNVWNRPDTSES